MRAHAGRGLGLLRDSGGGFFFLLKKRLEKLMFLPLLKSPRMNFFGIV
ncbi:hypothetical protein Chls_782 [Chlamydia suis]|uniref:Uncharacterized protein n=1 Tax=Chlamydia suis TaxID=83559 RepID=A0ABX6IUR8_9CHLA|nr:hypothetical protein Chls_782 [Chlamydia suis]